MSIINHIKSQPFVAATAAAALVHSGWALGTLFSGVQPTPPVIGDSLQLWIEFAIKTAAWHIPAVSIAFAFDVGQVVTAHEIRTAHGRGITPYRKYVTFVVFAAATYYLQMLYAAHHFPDLALGEGVSSAHRETVQAWLDVAVWVIPAFLPLSTLLYTFSGDSGHETAQQTPANATKIDATPPVAMDTAPAPVLRVDTIPNAELPAPIKAEVIGLPAHIEALVKELAQTPVIDVTPVASDPQPAPTEWIPLLPDEPATIEADTAPVTELYTDREPLPLDPVTGKPAVKAKAKTPPVSPDQQTMF